MHDNAKPSGERSRVQSMKRVSKCSVRRPRRTLLIPCVALAAFVAPIPIHAAPIDDHHGVTALSAQSALFNRARQVGEQFLVRIETVGGVQPLASLPTKRKQGEDPTDDPEKDREKNPNLFRDNPGSAFMLADGPTTGIVYSADGLILTSSFNFVREPSVITVVLPDGRRLPAKIKGRDQVRKLTLLKVDAEGLTTPEWAPPEQVRVGQWAIALGHGLGAAAPTVSTGIVSAMNRMMGNAIQTDAPLSPLNYGGPLLDTYGRVLGICAPMAQRPGELAGIEFYDSGVGFAVPGWRVREIADELATGKSFYRGWLGMQVDPHDRKNVRILRMADPSPLLEAGAQPGDRIVEINGAPIEHFGHLTKALYMLPAGQTVDIKLLRGADYVDVKATLARSEELGPLPEIEEPFDPSNPMGEEPAEEVPSE